MSNNFFIAVNYKWKEKYSLHQSPMASKIDWVALRHLSLNFFSDYVFLPFGTPRVLVELECLILRIDLPIESTSKTPTWVSIHLNLYLWHNYLNEYLSAKCLPLNIKQMRIFILQHSKSHISLINETAVLYKHSSLIELAWKFHVELILYITSKYFKTKKIIS